MKKTKGSTRWAKKTQQKYLGIHLIAEFWGGKIIENSRELERVLRLAAKKAGNTPLEFSFHSWPEHNYVALDIFTCGPKTFPEKALEVLKKKIKPQRVKVRVIKRGKVNV